MDNMHMDTESKIDELSLKINELNLKVDTLIALLTATPKKEKEIKSKKPTIPVIKITDSGEFIDVNGDFNTTSKIKEILKSNGAKWNKNNKSWKFDNKQIDVAKVHDLVSSACRVMNINISIE
jgi:hypothetical protein